MGGNVFECYEEQTDRRQYAKTVEALEGHAKKTMKYPQDLAPLFAGECKLPVLEKPPRPAKVGDKEPDEADLEIWKEDLRDLSKRKRVLRGSLSAIHAVIWGQCSEAMKARVKSLPEYDERTACDDCEWLLRNINAITMQFDSRHNGYIAMLDATAGFLNFRQQQHQSVSNYLETLKSHVDTIEYHGGTVVLNPALAPESDGLGNKLSSTERTKIARDATLAAALIRGADKSRFGTLITALSNQFSNGKDEYPTDLTSAYGLLVSNRTPTNVQRPTRLTQANDDRSHSTQSTAPTSDGSALTFAQRSAAGVPGTNGVLHDGITCYRCNGYGHYSCDCPVESSAATTVGTTLFQHGLMLAQGATKIDPAWILLDLQSTISVFCNCDMLKNIRPSAHVLRAVTNGGFQDSKLVGDFPNLGQVWFNPASIANILLLSAVRKICRVTMDTTKEASLSVHRLDGTQMKFVEHPCGLYVYDPSIIFPPDACTLLSTVQEQKSLFTPRDVAKAD